MINIETNSNIINISLNIQKEKILQEYKIIRICYKNIFIYYIKNVKYYIYIIFEPMNCDRF